MWFMSLELGYKFIRIGKQKCSRGTEVDSFFNDFFLFLCWLKPRIIEKDQNEGYNGAHSSGNNFG